MKKILKWVGFTLLVILAIVVIEALIFLGGIALLKGNFLGITPFMIIVCTVLYFIEKGDRQ